MIRLKTFTGRRTSKKASNFITRCKREISSAPLDLALDLGCGKVPRNEFGAAKALGIDIEESQDGSVMRVDLSAERLPFSSDSLDLVTAYDLIEHIPRWERTESGVRYPFIELMSEIFRVLRPGGYFYSETPAFPKPEAFQDPTHINIISVDTFRYYFAGKKTWAKMYGFEGSFKHVGQEWRGPHLLVLLKKP